ncbi:MAG: amidohydrolase family protein, partial [Ignavibacteriales bacterium]|nr:amidohydrolase family protein [Ignavibacteriales bacterium]
MKLTLWLFLCCTVLIAQTTRQVEGIRDNTPAVHALKNLTIIVSPGKKIDKGTIIIRDGIIQSAGANVQIPADAREWDCAGMTAYAGMIDLYAEYGLPKPKAGQPDTARGANYWNANIKSDYSAAGNFLPDKQSAEKLRAQGFTAVASVPASGIFKGWSVLVNTGNGTANDEIIKRDLFQQASLQQSGFGDGYPNSLMGRIALIRQTMIDAKWYADAQKIYAKNPNQPKPEENATLASLESVIMGKQKLVMETGDELTSLRAGAIAKEFSIPIILRGNGYEYRRIDAIKALNAPIILPVNFPDAPVVETPEDAFNAGYEELRHWDFASENPSRLKKAGIIFTLTANQLKDIAKFRSMVRTAIECGLNPDDALAAVTTVPASLAGMEKQLGTIEAGKIANIVLTDGDLFEEKTKIRETWVGGTRYEVKPKAEIDIRGIWSFSVAPILGNIDTATLDINGELESPAITMSRGTVKVKTSFVSFVRKQIAFSFDGDSLNVKGIVRLSGVATEKQISGVIEYPDGTTGMWKAQLRAPFTEKPDTTKPKELMCATNEPVFPDGAFGRKEIPKQQDVLVKNATIWTSGPQGNLEESDLLIVKGKISKIGKGLAAPSGVLVIDAKGKHVTTGLIDAHSHTAISGGVNESGQAITAEVRIGDVINADDINIYRQLAGGLTTVNRLHGSANAIGGQNSVIKLRWGMLPEQMKFEGAIPGIKFALGENPKQSNWGDNFTTRYPQTRMGVEQIIRDEFTAAREYDRRMKEKQNPNLIPPRRDLELETVAEILNKQRLVHSHCYRQDEILMLLRVSDDFHF